MSTSKTIIYKCDSCGIRKEYPGLTLPHGWVSPNLMEHDGEKLHSLHVCPNCARLAVDAWLPDNTWWGNTKNWGE